MANNLSRQKSFEKIFKKLSLRYPTPLRVQGFIRKLKYNKNKTMLSALDSVLQNKAHCMEGAMVAAAILELRGFPPLTVSFESQDGLDHVIYVFKQNGKWGSIGQSRDEGLHGRKPVFRSIRDLAWSYFDPYIDGAGKITAYQLINLDETKTNWRFSNKNLWATENYYLEKKHIKMKSSKTRYLKFYHRFLKGIPLENQTYWW